MLSINHLDTWLSSDMKAVVHNWVQGQPVLTFQSDHKSNTFQKYSRRVVTLLYVPGMRKMQVAELPALQ